jgi:HlyD family secretion protein
MAEHPDKASADKERLKRLINVGMALSYEKDIDRVLELVLEAAKELTYADAGTLYLLENEKLHFKILQNDSLKIKMGGTSGETIPFPPVDLVESNVSAYVAINGTSVNIPDVYDTDLFDFTGPKKFDQANDYTSKGMLVIPMKNHEGKVIGVLQLLNAKNRKTGEFFSFKKECEEIVGSLASQAAVALTNKLLVVHLQENIDDIQKLRTSEAELGNKLKDAFRDTDRKNSELQEALKKVGMVRYYAMIFIVLLGTGGWLYSGGLETLPYSITQYFVSDDDGMMEAGMEEGMQGEMGGYSSSATVQRGPVQDSITMSGTLNPLKIINIPSPLEGNVERVNFKYGSPVKQGQVLLEINASQLEVKYRDAKTALLQVEDELEKLEDWENSLEVTKAKRDINKAIEAIKKAERELGNSTKLFGLEIISANDLESAKQAVVSAKEVRQTAEEQLAITLDKGNEINLTIVRNKVVNAQAALDEVEGKLKKTVVTSTLSGIVMNPKNKGRSSKTIAVGSATKTGNTLVTIGDLSGFSINAKVDEVDVGKVKEGQKVLVTGDAFAGKVLKGKIAILSSEASSQGGFSGERATFNLVVAVKKINAKLKKKLLVGMSANLEVITYNDPKALLLPIDAVQVMGGSQAIVNLKNPDDAEPKEVEIKVGRTTLDSVEILKGLKEGDNVVY